MGLDTAELISREVLTFLEKHRDDLIEFTCELIRTPSINPPGDERQVVDVIRRHLASLGLDQGQILAREPERPNLISRLSMPRPGRVLMFNGHTDTKPVGEDVAHLWETDPLTPTFKGDRLYGLGSADMKAGVAAMIYAAAALQQVRDHLAGELLLVLTADEEAGSYYGARYLVEEGAVHADVGLLAEPCGLTRDWEYLCLANRGTLAFRTRVYGTQMHSSLSDRFPSVNAVVKAAQVIARMANEMTIEAPPHPYYPTGVTRNIGVRVEGGVYYGVLPGYAEFLSDLRLPPTISPSEARRQVEAFVAKLQEEDPDLRIEIVQDLPRPGAPERPLPEVSPDEPFVGMLLDAAQQVLGFRPPLGGIPGGTDAIEWHGRGGIPTIPAFGPGLLPVCHGPNEFVTVEAIPQAAKMYALAAARYLLGGSQ